MAVALDLVPEGADHLAVADIAAFADVDVATGKLQRRVGTHPFHLLDGVLEIEERRDLDDAADVTTTSEPTSSSVALRSIMPCFSMSDIVCLLTLPAA
jgi:hypothetical protein